MSASTKDMDLLDAHIGVFNRHNLRHVDWVVVALVLALSVIGLRILYHASPDSPPLYQKQAVWFALGGAVAFILVCMDYRYLVSLAPIMYAGSLILLIAVLVIGIVAKGGQHWLALGPFRLQPSELSKIALVYMLAWYLSLIRERVKRLPYFLLTFVIVGGVCGLILLQKDLGTMLVLLPVPFVMLYAAGSKRSHLALVIVAGLAVSPFAWRHLEDYQKTRLVSFILPLADESGSDYQAFLAKVTDILLPQAVPSGSGYQLLQAKIAVGSGQMTGKGFGLDTHAALEFVPEYHNDFIFALLGEGTGFVGGILVIGLFAALLLRGLVLARECQEPTAALLIVGALSILGCHAFVNIGITVGLMPVTGLPLPFFSYGGSFLLTAMLCIGTILSANVRRGMFEKT